jgi:hypothetical protein
MHSLFRCCSASLLQREAQEIEHLALHVKLLPDCPLLGSLYRAADGITIGLLHPLRRVPLAGDAIHLLCVQDPAQRQRVIYA